MATPDVACAKVSSDGTITQLGGRAAPEEVLTEEDAKRPDKVARLLARLLADVAALRRRFSPRRIDYEDVPVLGTGAAVQFQHGFSGRVRWWVVGWQCASSVAPILKEDTDATTSDTLVLNSYVEGTATIRVEEVG